MIKIVNKDGSKFTDGTNTIQFSLSHIAGVLAKKPAFHDGIVKNTKQGVLTIKNNKGVPYVARVAVAVNANKTPDFKVGKPVSALISQGQILNFDIK